MVLLRTIRPDEFYGLQRIQQLINLHLRKEYEWQTKKTAAVTEEWMGVLSHELRSPLASIKAMVQLSSKKLEAGDIGTVREYLGKINDKVDVLARQINGLLDVTRIQQGRLDIAPEIIELDPFVSDTVEELRVAVGNSHTLEMTGATGTEVCVDKYRLNQVMNNLVRNAVKYSPAGGKVIIRLSENEKFATVSVQDFGLGISDEDKEKIFQLYFRGSDARKENIQGLGVGLFVSKRVVELMGGNMEVESRVGEGSTFHLALPVFKKL